MDERVIDLIRQALVEDVGSGDITTNAIVAEGRRTKAKVVAKEAGVIAGIFVAKEVFRQVDRRIRFVPKVKDGTAVKKGKVIVALSGPARGILTGERVALNFLQHLSGVATLTRNFKLKIHPDFIGTKLKTKVKLLDTRKTIPGLRELQKYAVRIGGGVNHRFGLFDAVLIKDNHIKLAGRIEKAVRVMKAERAGKAKKAVEVEAKTIGEVRRAIKAGADRILLDNMDDRTLREAVKLCRKEGVLTEASGGVNLQNVATIAKTGVDFISVGALTHSAPALDISLKVL